MKIHEVHLLVLGEEAGKRTAKRYPVGVPLQFVRGQWSKLSDRALNDLIKDLRHEQMSRAGELFVAEWDEEPEDLPAPRPRWNPAASQITNHEDS